MRRFASQSSRPGANQLACRGSSTTSVSMRAEIAEEAVGDALGKDGFRRQLHKQHGELVAEPSYFVYEAVEQYAATGHARLMRDRFRDLDRESRVVGHTLRPSLIGGAPVRP